MTAQIRTGLLAFALCRLYGQTADSPLNFDAASVKPAASAELGGGGGRALRTKTGRDSDAGGPGTLDPGRIHYPRVTLKDLLTRAYDVNDYQIAGPGWLDTERFAIEATMPPDTTKQQFRVMLQNLLVERFKMTIHRETKELPVYSLVVGRNGPKMNGSVPATIKGPGGVPLSELKTIVHLTLAAKLPPSYRWVGSQATMSDLAQDLTHELHRPVTDATALEAKYNFTLNFSRDALASDANVEAEPLSNIFSALQSIGLKLEQKRAPVEVIVVDHAEKTPVGN
jgi:uncharacterized protein (TIGR03435 family)